MRTIYLYIATGALLFQSWMCNAQNATILKETTTYIVEGYNNLTVDFYRKIKIQNKHGRRHGDVKIHYDDFSKLMGLSMTVYDAKGKKIKKYKQSDALDVSVTPNHSVSDSRYVIIHVDYASYPYTVEIAYQKKHKGFINVGKWSAQPGYNVSVIENKLRVIHPKEVNVNLTYLNGLPEAVKKVEDNEVTYELELKDLESIKSKKYDLTFSEKVPSMLITPDEFELDGYHGSMKTWADFGNWFASLNNDRGGLTAETKEFLSEVKATSQNTEQAVKSVFKYMQSRTRYVGIFLGIGGFQSLTSKFVDEHGYGDCKALTNYTKEMLQHIGIASNYVLVEAGSQAPQQLIKRPSNQFNHVFLAVPNEKDTIWLECTGKGPANFLGSFTDDREVLWVKPNDSQVLRTPKYSPKDNYIKRDVHITLNKDGSADCKLYISKKGLFYQEASSYKSMSTDNEKDRYNYKRFPFSSFKILSHKVEEAQDSVIFKEFFHLQVSNLAKASSGRLIMDLNLLDEEMYLPPSAGGDEDHDDKVKIRHGKFTNTTYLVTFPEGYRCTFNLPKHSIESNFGNYKLDIKSRDNQLEINREFLLKDGYYTSDEFNDLKTFLDEVKQLDNSKVMMKSRT